MLREETVFGPIHSRRLGRSLGVNLLPSGGKICNFDCIYCECGWNRDGRDDTVLPSAAKVRSALEDKLSEMLLSGEVIDSITFSGDGEPTLNPEFPRIIDDTIALRDAYCPGTKVSVLSNATRLHDAAVMDALRRVDNPIMKLDAPTDELAALINHPAPGYSVSRVVEHLRSFGGDFILQTMFLRSCVFDSSAPQVLYGWMRIALDLRPREVMVYTIDRPTPEAGLEAFTEAEMRALIRPLTDAGLKVKVYGKSK